MATILYLDLLASFRKRIEKRLKTILSPLTSSPAYSTTCPAPSNLRAEIEVAEVLSSMESGMASVENRVGTQTDLTGTLVDQLTHECSGLRQEKWQLQEQLAKLTKDDLSWEGLEGDDGKVLYYSGLPSFNILKAIYNFCEEYIPDNPMYKMAKFQQFMSVLRLRLNLQEQDLAYRFGTSQTTISRVWKRWIEVLYVRLRHLIIWPSREELRKTMPLTFKLHFDRCVIIIDCFDIKMERPSDLMARAQTYSSYKHHNTIKFLIGITPQGSISYISKGWGGRVSDKVLTESSGFLGNLLPGDVVLADRGFNVGNSVGMYCAELKMPPFTKGKSQLARKEVDTARQLSRVRIHVERVIGQARKKYIILNSRLPITSVMAEGMVDKIVTICCALCNCCDSVVNSV
eukprot:m.264795 g.264795  ORF g.264795 m.264795 type:complete len:402 (+) comp40480_c0_seq15:225-1430(+)